MGLLDDAIRDHLELKRRHGAAEDEVRRQEQEALGPPREGEVPEPLAPPAPVDETVVTPAAEAVELDEPELEADLEPIEEPEPEPEPEAPAAYAAPAPAPPAPEPEPDLYEDEPWLDDADPEPAPAAPAPEPPAGEAAQPGDDVLEATPEFLQETPEHDRLWFEQKPPKDFDFDK